MTADDPMARLVADARRLQEAADALARDVAELLADEAEDEP